MSLVEIHEILEKYGMALIRINESPGLIKLSILYTGDADHAGVTEELRAACDVTLDVAFFGG